MEDVEQFLGIIKNNRIYYPRYKQLNDPLEEAGVNINIPGGRGSAFIELLMINWRQKRNTVKET